MGAGGRGSIPARAAEPPALPLRAPPRWVYPCSRRGTVPNTPNQMRCRGLSLLAQGNHQRVWLRSASPRSIPARAGEPLPTPTAPASTRVYPCSRRGTSASRMRRRATQGLSLLAQGNPDHHRVRHRRAGSIPARAGEPRRSDAGSRPTRVYPCSRRGTSVSSFPLALIAGLSLLAQGNRRQQRVSPRRRRSIPARAGEPRNITRVRWLMWVYPCSRRGTGDALCRYRTAQGLSLLAQGNPERQQDERQFLGSIPARAGEPVRCRSMPGHTEVYPCSRRGTPGSMVYELLNEGLSLLAQGNLYRHDNYVSGSGSIPARAGEPSRPRSMCARSGVYPCSRRGTPGRGPCQMLLPGLSLLAQGNLYQRKRPVKAALIYRG